MIIAIQLLLFVAFVFITLEAKATRTVIIAGFAVWVALVWSLQFTLGAPIT